MTQRQLELPFPEPAPKNPFLDITPAQMEAMLERLKDLPPRPVKPKWPLAQQTPWYPGDFDPRVFGAVA